MNPCRIHDELGWASKRPIQEIVEKMYRDELFCSSAPSPPCRFHLPRCSPPSAHSQADPLPKLLMPFFSPERLGQLIRHKARQQVQLIL
jgi:hypothetical protein